MAGIESGLRVNDRIKAKTVRLIDEKGVQVGIVSIDEARKMAQERGYDLVEVSPSVSPPVCKLLNYGKFLYEQRKRTKESKKKQRQIHIKEIRVSPIIGKHDLDVKLKHAREFIMHGDDVIFTMRIRGRMSIHMDFCKEIMLNILKSLEDIAKVTTPLKNEMGRLIMRLSRK